MSEMQIHINFVVFRLDFTELAYDFFQNLKTQKQKDLMHGWLPLFAFSKSHTDTNFPNSVLQIEK